jgi:predicted DsbA family dithiol-disulfide isomerase
VDVTPKTLLIYSDIGCPWAHAAVHRLHAARRRVGLEQAVRFDHRAFPLELFNRRATPKLTLDAEIPVVGGIEPDAGWQLWSAPLHEYPVTTLPALEAVQAAKREGLEASEALDRALRRAFFAESRCISMHHVVVDVAKEAGVDAAAIADALEEGWARALVHEQCRAADESDEVKGSPHVFAPGTLAAHNPGVRMHWEGGHDGFPVVDADDPLVAERLVLAAAGD